MPITLTGYYGSGSSKKEMILRASSHYGLGTSLEAACIAGEKLAKFVHLVRRFSFLAWCWVRDKGIL